MEKTYPKIKIGFFLTDLEGQTFSAESEVEVIEEFNSEKDVIFEQFNNFLRQVGYVRPNAHILENDITDEEYDTLSDYLEKIRENKKDLEDAGE